MCLVYKRAMLIYISIYDYNWISKGSFRQDVTFNSVFLELGVWRKYFPLKRGSCITQFELLWQKEYKLWGVFVL